MNKKSQVITLTVGTLVVIAVIIGLILIFSFGLVWFTTTHLLQLAGASIIVLTLIFGLKDYNKDKGKVVLILFLIGAGLLVLPYVFTSLQQTIYGTSYLSIDRIDYVGEGTFFHILATGGSAEELKIDWDKDEISSKMNGYSVDRGVTANIIINKLQHSFPITISSQPVNLIGKTDTYSTIGGEASCDMSDCNLVSLPRPDATWIYIYAYRSDAPSFTPYRCMCIYQYVNSKIGTFASGSANLDYNINFNVEGESKDMNNNNKVVSLKNGNFIAEYRGNIGTDYQLNAPQYEVLQTEGKYQWLVQKNAMSYNSRGPIANPQSYLTQCAGSISGTTVKTNVDTCISNFNSDVNTALAYKNDEYINTIKANSIILEGDRLIVDEGISTFNPLFTIKVNAAWVGLKELKGDPIIQTCASDVSFDSSKSEITNLKVYNKGTEAGQFDYTYTCSDSQIKVIGSGGYVEKLAILDIPITISGTNNNPTTLQGTCTHTITDKKSQKSVQCTSKVGIRYTEYCNPNAYRCSPTNAKILQQCDKDGLAWNDKETCAKTCGYDNTLKTIKCIEEECPTDQTRCTDGICREKCIDDDYCRLNPNDPACKPQVCGWWEDEVPAGIREDCGFLSWKKVVPLMSCETITFEKSCKTAGYVIALIIGGFITLIVIIIALLYMPKYSKSKNKRK